ncbi:MAG: phenylacetate--CoA ligase family protein [Firmicutes bacterium]|nr:phenylacetate--CoA ligase family protein [Bacillota bacterium]
MRKTPLDPWINRKVRGDRTGGEVLARKDLELYQIRKLRETIGLAKERSRFYRERLAGIEPESIEGMGDLSRLPFTTVEDLESGHLGFLCVSQGEISRVVTLNSSGTTGPPKRLCFTREDLESTVDFFHHGMSTLVGPGDRVLILLPGERPDSVGDLLAAGLRRLGAKAVPHGMVVDQRSALEIIQSEDINSIVGVPTQVLTLARYGEHWGMTRSFKIDTLLLTTDHVPAAIARELESLWGCKVFNHYGMTEMGLGGGVECEARDGYHLREADLYFEIVDPVSGHPLAEGEEGEIVFTTLTRRGMPLIRYRTGDVSSFVPGSCPCGSVLPRMKRVRRRLEGLIELPGRGRLTLAELDEALFPIRGVLDFTASLTGDALHVKVKSGEWADREEIDARIQQGLEGIPGIAAARGSGGMRIEIDSETGWMTRPVGVGKRVLVDQRKRG